MCTHKYMYIVSETLKDIIKVGLIKRGLIITKCKSNPRNIRRGVRKEKRKTGHFH